MIRRQTAARTVRGGRTTRLAMTARPGSGLTASDLTLVRPSGNAIVFCTRDRGPAAATGPTTAATTASAVAVMLTAARRPSLARSRTAATARAGPAVAFMAAAAPSASAASI